jgi:hypothetical protein
LSNRERRDEEVGRNIQRSVGVIHAVRDQWLMFYAWMSTNLRVLIDTFRKRPHCHIPVGIDRYTCEDGCDDGCYSTSCTKTHSDVDRHSRAFKSEDAPVLQ